MCPTWLILQSLTNFICQPPKVTALIPLLSLPDCFRFPLNSHPSTFSPHLTLSKNSCLSHVSWSNPNFLSLTSLSSDKNPRRLTSTHRRITYSYASTTAVANVHTNPTTQERIAVAMDSLKLNTLRLEDSDPAVIRGFSYTSASLLLTIPNSLVLPIASNRSNALRWLYGNVVPFYPRAKITTISVGNDLLDVAPQYADALMDAIRNIYFALRGLGICNISVSSSFSFVSAITTPFPPSAAQFQQTHTESLFKPLLHFLRDTNSSFLINVYPYNLYRLHPEIPLGMALFNEYPFNFRDDLTTGVRYDNLFDMMVDALISAMAVTGYENIPIIVTETGWPSSSTSAIEADANMAYGEMYLKGLVGHLKTGVGTPLRREGRTEVYIYELFHKEASQNSSPIGRTWDVMHAIMTKKYGIDFTISSSVGIFKRRALVEMASFSITSFLNPGFVRISCVN